MSTAAESLKRLQTRQAERQARLDAAAQLEKVADGRDRMKNWRRPVLAQPIKAMLRVCWRVYSVNKANNALYVDCQNLPASFVQTDPPALLGLFIGQYLLCYLVLRLLRESALVSQLAILSITARWWVPH